MVGKKIGIQATGKILLSALLKKHNIPEKDVEVSQPVTRVGLPGQQRCEIEIE